VVSADFTVPDTVQLDHIEAYFTSCRLEHPTQTVSMTGAYHDLTATAGELYIRQLELGGAIDDPNQSGTWPARGIVPNLTRTRISSPSGARVNVIHGSLHQLPDPEGHGITAVWATELAMGNEASEDPCTSEPHGDLAVRDVDGNWFDVLFDGDTGGTCDGCGTISFAGTLVGEVCPDLSPLFEPPT
jgi:hypothetical protein